MQYSRDPSVGATDEAQQTYMDLCPQKVKEKGKKERR